MTAYLSTNFQLDEFTQSQTAARAGIANDPPPDVLENLYRTAYAMETVRQLLGGKPILISSAYRCPALNKLVGSKPSSAHVFGHAVDFTCPAFGTPHDIVATLISSGSLVFDQLIVEYGRWVHASFDPRSRRQALIIDKAGTRSFQ